MKKCDKSFLNKNSSCKKVSVMQIDKENIKSTINRQRTFRSDLKMNRLNETWKMFTVVIENFIL